MLTKMELPIYLDAAATTPVHPEVLEAMLPYFTQHFGNPHSRHERGVYAKKAIAEAKNKVAKFLNVDEGQVVFTSGATEAIAMAIIGFWENNSHIGNHLITAKTEHKAVLAVHEYLESIGCEVSYVPTDNFGCIDLDVLESMICENTILVSLMHVNNETGLIHDVNGIADVCRRNNCAFFADCTQAPGKIEIDYSHPGISMLCISGHKFFAPKGIGVLVKKNGINPKPRFYENDSGDVRPGTPNTPAIVGLGKACELIDVKPKSNWIPAAVSAFFTENGIHEIKFLPSTESIKVFLLPENFSEWKSLERLIYFSTGSACTTGLMQNSHVYEYLKLPANRVIRLSVC